MDFLINKNTWLPKSHVNWTDADYEYFPTFYDVSTVPFIVAIILYFIRVFFEKYIAQPLGVCLGIKVDKFDNEQLKRVTKTIEMSLEEYYKSCKKPSESILNEISNQLKIPHDSVKAWFEKKEKLSKPSKMNKFTESTWRFTFYLLIFLYGVFALKNKSWAWNTIECWRGFPRLVKDPEIYWYYMLELGFYWSLLCSQFSDIKRKDFWQMFLHHVVTISLMVYSFQINFHRIGSLILVLHDSVDFWLELAKMAKYANLQFLCDSTFVIFTILWFITRLVIYPSKILYSTTFETPIIFGGRFLTFNIFNFLLLTLQILHIIWFYMILRVAYKAITLGKVDKDDRSESDDASNHEKQN